MAEDNAGTNANFTVPSGFRLVTDDSYKKNAEAANDLKQLKGNIPDGFDVTKLKDVVKELQDTKDANKTDLDKLTQKVAALTADDKTKKDEVKILKEENRLLQINQIVAGLIAEKSAQGNYLAGEFVDRQKLAALDPGDGEKFLTAVHEILATAWERQEEVAGKIGRKINFTPATGMAAGETGAGAGSPSVADLQTEQLKIMQDLQTKGRFGGRVIEESKTK